MKPRFLLTVALALLVAGSVFVATAAADEAVVPFKATYVTYPRVNGGGPDYFTLAIPGEGQSTHLGKTTWYSDCTIYTNAPPPLVQVCTMSFIAANGDRLSGTTYGFVELAGTSATFWGNFMITGDTGRFEGVSGHGTYEGTATTVPGSEVGSIYFDGTLFK